MGGGARGQVLPVPAEYWRVWGVESLRGVWLSCTRPSTPPLVHQQKAEMLPISVTTKTGPCKFPPLPLKGHDYPHKAAAHSRRPQNTRETNLRPSTAPPCPPDSIHGLLLVPDLLSTPYPKVLHPLFPLTMLSPQHPPKSLPQGSVQICFLH